MEFNLLLQVADRARSQRRLASTDVAFLRDVVPVELESFPRLNLPKVMKHPAGFSISGPPVGTFLRSALLIAGKKALGNRYGGSPFYEMVERDLAFGIMRSHFHHGYPKGKNTASDVSVMIGEITTGETRIPVQVARKQDRQGESVEISVNGRALIWGASNEARGDKSVSYSDRSLVERV